jgi:predicted transcriptional regulator
MKPNEIRAELVLRKITLVSIAKKLGIAVPSVSQVLVRKRTTAYVREAIAEAINKPVSEVFPD